MEQNMNTEITSAIETITPDDAKLMLAENRHNRPINAGQVSSLARDIRNGDWQLNGEAIKLATDDMLLDGQHRLSAIVEAGIPVQSLVIRGLPRDTQQTMDTGMARSLSDVLKLAGEEQHTALAAVIRSLYGYGQTGWPMPPRSKAVAPTTKQGLALLEQRPALREAAKFSQVGEKTRWADRSIIACCYYLFTQIPNVSPEIPRVFFQRLATGEEIKGGDPIYALRERLVKEFIEQGRVERQVQAAFIVRSWNAWRKNETVKRLYFQADEPCPVIAGLEEFKV